MANRLKNVAWVFLGAIALYWGITTLVGTVLSGPLDPPAAPAPTGKTLPELEPRIGIFPGSLPITISDSGSYYLLGDLDCPTLCAAGVNGILIEADNVDIDLMGYALIGPGNTTTSGDGIRVAFSKNNIRIHNGTVRDWGKHGVSGFFAGVGSRQLENLRAGNNGGDGLRANRDVLISNCIAGTKVLLVRGLPVSIPGLRVGSIWWTNRHRCPSRTGCPSTGSLRSGYSLVGPSNLGSRFSRCEARPSAASGPLRP